MIHYMVKSTAFGLESLSGEDDDYEIPKISEYGINLMEVFNPLTAKFL